jgi:hypothetical protein
MPRDENLIVDDMTYKKKDQKFQMILLEQLVRKLNQTLEDPSKLVFPVLTSNQHKNANTKKHCYNYTYKPVFVYRFRGLGLEHRGFERRSLECRSLECRGLKRRGTG